MPTFSDRSENPNVKFDILPDGSGSLQIRDGNDGTFKTVRLYDYSSKIQDGTQPPAKKANMLVQNVEDSTRILSNNAPFTTVPGRAVVREDSDVTYIREVNSLICTAPENEKLYDVTGRLRQEQIEFYAVDCGKTLATFDEYSKCHKRVQLKYKNILKMLESMMLHKKVLMNAVAKKTLKVCSRKNPIFLKRVNHLKMLWKHASSSLIVIEARQKKSDEFSNSPNNHLNSHNMQKFHQYITASTKPSRDYDYNSNIEEQEIITHKQALDGFNKLIDYQRNYWVAIQPLYVLLEKFHLKSASYLLYIPHWRDVLAYHVNKLMTDNKFASFSDMDKAYWSQKSLRNQIRHSEDKLNKHLWNELMDINNFMKQEIGRPILGK